MKSTAAKTHGIHYTPPELAQFLASLLAAQLSDHGNDLHVLDPACGDGALLSAFCQALPAASRKRLTLVGYETDRSAINAADAVLSPLSVKQLTLVEGDFLEAAASGRLLCSDAGSRAGFDAVIANPPYVRTQVLGAHRAGLLAAQFGLTGRVDLYQAFTQAMAGVLRPKGVLGLLTSNRFLTVKSGAALRAMLRSQFALQAIYDLGDTKLFAASVLPVIVVASKRKPRPKLRCRFDRVYRDRSTPPTRARPSTSKRTPRSDAATTDSGRPIPLVQSVLTALGDSQTSGLVRAPSGLFRVERGFLSHRPQHAVWTLANADSDAWLKTVDRHVGLTFNDVGHVRVGIKTTADEVFIRDDWTSLPLERRPERKLLRPLLRHFGAARWLASTEQQVVLYPHVVVDGRRQAADLNGFPRASRYLESHRERLSRRQYIVDSGRQWYEIWVPHHPSAWSLPKIVFPDISVEPRFFLDRTGAVVNGDCYWITLRPGREADWLLLMLAVANSSFIVRYYDIAFHNQLYAGRRRFMTQYVKHFPLPDIESRPAQSAIALVREVLATPVTPPARTGSPRRRAASSSQPSGLATRERKVDELVWQAFGLVAPAGER